MSFSLGGQSAQDPNFLLEDCIRNGQPVDWADRANSWFHDLGPSVGHGWVLFRKAQIDALGINKKHVLDIYSPNPVGSISIPKVSIDRMDIVVSSREDDPDSTFLCFLVDDRHYRRQTLIAKSYNLRKDGAGYHTDTLNSATPWTWQEMVTNVWDSIFSTADGSSTLPFTPDGTPENFSFHGISAYDALNVVLDRVGCALRFKPTDTTYSIVRINDTSAETYTKAADQMPRIRGALIADSQTQESVLATEPETIRVFFWRLDDGAPTGGCTPFHSVDVANPNTSNVQGDTVAAVVDDMNAIFAAGVIQNASAVGTRATERANDFLRQISPMRFSRVYSGIHHEDILPGSLIKSISWSHRPSQVEDSPGPLAGGIMTTIASYPGLRLIPNESSGMMNTVIQSRESYQDSAVDGGMWHNGGWWGGHDQTWFSSMLSQQMHRLGCDLIANGLVGGATGFSGARAHLTSAEAEASNTVTVNWDVVDYDVHDTADYFDLGTDSTLITIPEDGEYHIVAQLHVTISGSPPPTDVDEITAEIFSKAGGTGADTSEGNFTIRTGTDNLDFDTGLILQVTAENQFSSGDTLFIQAFAEDSTSSASIQVIDVTTWVAIHRILGGGGGSGGSQNLWATIDADTGSTTANSPTDTVTFSGGTNVTTSISGDTVTINSSAVAGRSSTTVTGALTLNATHDVVWANASSDFTITLPSAASNGDQVYLLKKIDSGTNVVSITAGGSDDIEGDTTVDLFWSGDAIEIMSDGAGVWHLHVDKRIPHACRLDRINAQPISNVTFTKIAFDLSVYDIGGIGDIVTNDRVDVRRGGRYLVTAQWGHLGVGSTVNIVVEIRVNGTAVMVGQNQNPDGDDVALTTCTLDLAATDFVEMWVWQDSGSSVNTETAVAIRPKLFVAEVR